MPSIHIRKKRAVGLRAQSRDTLISRWPFVREETARKRRSRLESLTEENGARRVPRWSSRSTYVSLYVAQKCTVNFCGCEKKKRTEIIARGSSLRAQKLRTEITTVWITEKLDKQKRIERSLCCTFLRLPSQIDSGQIG